MSFPLCVFLSLRPPPGVLLLCREDCIFTIDPATARDLDDALSCKQLPDGRLLGYIATGLALTEPLLSPY